MGARKYTDEYELNVIVPYYKKYGCEKTVEKFNLVIKTLYNILKRNKTPLRGFKGKNSPRWKRLLVKCDQCGIYFTKQRSQVKITKYNFHNRKCMGKWRSNNTSRENSSNYIHGRSIKLQLLRKETFKHDNHKCRVCGTFGPRLNVVIHHIKPVKLYPEQFYDVDNIITLCRQHHSRILNHEEDFEKFFYGLIKDRVVI